MPKQSIRKLTRRNNLYFRYFVLRSYSSANVLFYCWRHEIIETYRMYANELLIQRQIHSSHIDSIVNVFVAILFIISIFFSFGHSIERILYEQKHNVERRKHIELRAVDCRLCCSTFSTFSSSFFSIVTVVTFTILLARNRNHL